MPRILIVDDEEAMRKLWLDSCSTTATTHRERVVAFSASPALGKTLHFIPSTTPFGYERLPEFIALCRRFDPTGNFATNF